MKKYLAVAAVLLVAACGKKDDAAPAADTTATVAPAPADSMAGMSGMQHDSMMVRDSAQH